MNLISRVQLVYCLWIGRTVITDPVHLSSEVCMEFVLSSGYRTQENIPRV